jgi:hypothetical protein
VAARIALREPTTTLTDLALAVVGSWFAVDLVLQPHPSAAHAWAEAFGCGALGGLFGAIVHGLADYLSPRTQRVFWHAALIFTGAGAIIFAVAAGQSAAPSQEDLIMRAGLIALAFYVVAVIARPTFATAALVSFVALAIVLVSAFAISRSSIGAAAWIVAGVGLTGFGFGLQRARVSLHRHLNNNDLYHLLQLAAFVCFYRAAIALT